MRDTSGLLMVKARLKEKFLVEGSFFINDEKRKYDLKEEAFFFPRLTELFLFSYDDVGGAWGMKEKLLTYLRNQTAFFDPENVSDVFSAGKIAEQFVVKRNTVSHYLNQLHEEGQLIKITTRPVYFLHKEAFEAEFYPLKRLTYSQLEEIVAEQPLFNQKQDLFSLLIGSDGSLARGIDLLKTAAYYPAGGLPVLLTGESGTGKSYIVKIFHQFCIDQELLTEDAPFVTFNCAQYANNPELLTSNLFGYRQGAFTGAKEDQEGAFEAADGGILFLDEVHRLPPEGQEKLFTYLDQGKIYRMGEASRAREVSVRLVFATTEEITSTFLTTFIRRIPIQITLPPLAERTQGERLALILSFFIQEQRKIGLPLEISGQTIHLLKNTVYQGNIGALKNAVRVTVARSFAENHHQEKVFVQLYHLPEELLTQTNNHGSAPLEEVVIITDQTTLESLLAKKNREQRQIIHTYENLLITYQQAKSLATCEEQLKQGVEELFDFLLFETNRQQNQELLLFITQYVRDILKQMETSYQITFNGNSIYAVSYYLFQRSSVRWEPEDCEIQQQMGALQEAVKYRYSQSYQYAERMLELIRPKLDIDVFEMDRIILTIYLNKLGLSKDRNYPKAIIIAHGYATASSIANVANRLLGSNIYEAFDMPLDTTPQQIAEEVLLYTEKNDISNGLVILVDMGALKEIYQYFSKALTVPLAIMNNVTTPLALAVGEKIQQDQSLEEVMETVSECIQPEWEIIYPTSHKTKAIITTCFTGIGTASKISQLVEKSFPSPLPLVILPYEFEKLYQEKQREAIFDLYDVLGIIGTTNPQIPQVEYLSLEELISGNGSSILSRWLAELTEVATIELIENQLVKNFSLEKVIDSVTILDTEKIISEIEVFMQILEELIGERISNDRKLALYVHISCLVERLIRNMPIESYQGYAELVECHEKELRKIKEAFSVIEKDYSVKIPDSEIAYICDILFQTVDLSLVEEDF